MTDHRAEIEAALKFTGADVIHFVDKKRCWGCLVTWPEPGRRAARCQQAGWLPLIYRRL